jgi:hypothetical protein
MKRIVFCLLTIGALVPCLGVQTETWVQNERADFEKGKAKGLSVRSDGRLVVAPVFRELFDSSSAYIWALGQDSKGNLWAGGGGPGGDTAKLTMVAPNGTSKVVAELDGLEIQSIVIDSRDRVYAATSPDGKVYRINAGGAGTPEVFYDPKEKYIWSLAFDRQGNLYVATGDRGNVHRVTPAGQGSVFFRTEETHARSIAVDGKGNLIVGTEPSGLILRVNSGGEGFILYQSAKREITSLAIGNDGSIYAAGVANKTALPSPIPVPAAQPAAPAKQAAGSTGQAGGAQVGSQGTRTPLPPLRIPPGGSELYRIEPDGAPSRIWSHSQDVIYSMLLDAQDRPLLATGNDGNIYRVESPLVSTRLIAAQSSQVLALLSGRNGAVYAGTGNVGKVFQLGPDLEREGSLESDILDTGAFATWGRLMFRGELRGGKIALMTRSGNLDRPQQHWSNWSEPISAVEGARVTSPPARFLQWRAVLTAASDGKNSPELVSVQVAHLPKNVAPQVSRIEITPPNYQFPTASLRANVSDTITLQPLGQRAAAKPQTVLGQGSVSMKRATGYIGARWSASDANEDQILYQLHIRGVDETVWKPLAQNIEDPHYSWDSSAFPDGRYVLKVTASDSPSNTPGKQLEASLESDPFLIDNTPPVIEGLTAARNGANLQVKWRARDASSLLTSAEYSVNGGEWKTVDPVTVLTDSPEHDYVLVIENAKPGEHTLAVRVMDEFENQAVAKVVVK